MKEQEGAKFTAIDNAIVEAIRQARSPVRFSTIMANSNVDVAARVAAVPDRSGVIMADRVVDRRLQAMRKAKKLDFSRTGGWSVSQ